MAESKYTTVSIPKPLYEKVKKFIEGTGFTSVSDYVTYLLRQVISEEEGVALPKEQEEKIKARLRALGYID